MGTDGGGRAGQGRGSSQVCHVVVRGGVEEARGWTVGEVVRRLEPATIGGGGRRRGPKENRS